MRLSPLLLSISLWAVAPLDIKQIDATKLPNIPGPQASQMTDPARGLNFTGIEAQIRTQDRRSGSVQPAVALPPGSLKVSDQMTGVAGWKAYRVEVPAKGSVHVRLHGNHEAWFQVRAVNRWGVLEKGMLQNVIPTGNPEARYLNPKNETMSVYFVVDTTELNMQGEAYTLDVTVS